jgi:RNA polymerase sigma factor (sigma-70 family)
MATSRISGVIQHLRRAVLLQEGAGLTDGQLLEGFVSRRDEAALAALVRRHGPMVWGVCRRVLRNYHDAEDAFQATFLVLVRKAASIVPREMVANWLYGVAHQTALKARATAARRGARERQVPDMPEPAVTEQELWRDVKPLLDEELRHLPDKYRVVIVLCDLRGQTRKEAARQLGCPEGTVAGRLARARAMLAKRLTQRGVALSGWMLATVLSQKVASAGVPSSVVSSTIKAASLFAVGQAAATGAISVKVAALTEGVVKAMFLNKIKSVMAVVLMVAILTGSAGLIYQMAQATEQLQAQGATPSGEQQGAQATKPTETTPEKVVLAYGLNDAKGDEEFLGHALRVSGIVERVQRVEIGNEPHYLLTLDDADHPHNSQPLSFIFRTDSQKQLTKLEMGQRVRIEGVCQGRTAKGCDAITFTKCEILKD